MREATGELGVLRNFSVEESRWGSLSSPKNEMRIAGFQRVETREGVRAAWSFSNLSVNSYKRLERSGPLGLALWGKLFCVPKV